MGSRQQILLVDHNRRNLELLTEFLRKEDYETIAISTLQELEQILGQVDQIGLALVDIAGFDRRIWGYCETLSNLNIPILVISPKQVANIQQESLTHGAQGVLFKPLVAKELTAVIRSLLRGH
jgi:DNA-binding response OmpR family regulator